jgi:hypothetical protein
VIDVGGGRYAVAYSTTDPATERLRVVDGPIEYTAPYIAFDERSTVRVAVVYLPPRAGRTQPPIVQNLDVAGNNLGNI